LYSAVHPSFLPCSRTSAGLGSGRLFLEMKEEFSKITLSPAGISEARNLTVGRLLVEEVLLRCVDMVFDLRGVIIFSILRLVLAFSGILGIY